MSSKHRVAYASLAWPINARMLIGAALGGVLWASTWAFQPAIPIQLSYVLLFVTFGGGTLAGTLVSGWLSCRSQLAWLAKIPGPFDREAYLDALDHRAQNAALEVRVEHADGNVQLIRSMPMETNRSQRNGAHYRNSDLHSWFRTVYEQSLREPLKAGRVKALSVTYVPFSQ